MVQRCMRTLHVLCRHRHTGAGLSCQPVRNVAVHPATVPLIVVHRGRQLRQQLVLAASL